MPSAVVGPELDDADVGVDVAALSNCSATPPTAAGRCCDICDGPLAEAKAPAPAVKASGDGEIRDAIVAVVEAASPGVGRTRVVEILRGGRSKVVLKYGYDQLPGYGSYGEWRAEEVLAEVDALIASGSLASTGGRFPKLRTAQAA